VRDSIDEEMRKPPETIRVRFSFTVNTTGAIGARSSTIATTRHSTRKALTSAIREPLTPAQYGT
jgi:hypothetical protein